MIKSIKKTTTNTITNRKMKKTKPEQKKVC